MKTNIAVLDVESTDLDESAEIVEICIRDLNQNTLYHSYVMPLGEISKEALGIHGLTFEFLAAQNAPFWSEIAGDIKQAVDGYTICAYNAPFDRRLIEQTSNQQNIPSPTKDNKWVCASISAKNHLGPPKTATKRSGFHQLTGAFEILCPELADSNIKAHTAGDDVYMTVEVVKKLQAFGVEIEPVAEPKRSPSFT